MEYLTREFCKKITETSNAFYCSKTILNNAEVEIYNYRLAGLSDFKKNNAFELRGLTFVKENNEWKRFLALNKFFNVNETEGWLLDDLKNKRLIKIQEKLDGSFIQPILINDKIYMKSKTSFKSIQAIYAQEILDSNYELKNEIFNFFENNKIPLFELICFKNQIVVNYEMPLELRLIQIRDLKTGEYVLDEKIFKDFYSKTGIKYSQVFDNYTLDDLLKLAKETTDDIEGWILSFEDGNNLQLAKLKTERYFTLHHLLSPDNVQLNVLIENILEERIDDILSQIQNSPKKDYIISVTELVIKDFNEKVVKVKKLLKEYNEMQNRKEFAKKYSNIDVFGCVMKSLNNQNEKFIESCIKQMLLRKTRKLTDAEKYFESLKSKFKI